MEDSSSNLLAMKTNENNNMLETQKFELYDCEKTLKSEKPGIVTQKQTRVLFIVAAILIGFAVLSLITAVILVVRFSGRGEEKITSQNQTSYTTISPTPSSSIPVQSTSTLSPSISTSFTIHPTKSTVVFTTTVTMETSKPTSTVISTTATTTVTTATVVISSTPVSVCESDEFRCSDGTCIAKSYVCDGKPHCPLAEDEHKSCECSETQFRCHSGQCIEAKFRCDGYPQCNDKSDEMNCTDCTGFECDSGQCLWSNSVVCNSHVDCLDLSDEKNCDSRRGYTRCDNGLLVRTSKFCDGVDDCFDNSDEQNCGMRCNPLAERICADMRKCIMIEWFCDGHTDCSDGSDEKNCGTCDSDEFQCSDYSCIPAQQVCDGTKQCAAGDDEVDCLKLRGSGISESQGIITVKSDDQFLPVCGDVWTSGVADEVCQYFGFRGSSGTSYIPETTAGVTVSQGFMRLKDSTLAANQSLLAKFTKLPMCSAKKVVSVKCQQNVCGERKVEIMTPFIVGATIPPKGKWPWVVSLSMLGQDVCGGVIVNKRWILTSAHCIVTTLANYTLAPHFFEITAGTNSRQRQVGDKAQRRRVDKIVLHPQMKRLETGLTEWDLALLHIDSPLFYGDYIQPICFPDQDESFPTSSQCYLAGWGYINTQEVSVNKLREGKMRLWGEEDCANNGISKPLNTNATMCAGYYSGAISACKGDSGSPLMCSDNRGQWTVVGVMSHGVNGCDGGSLRRANRYARVSTSIDWIQMTTGG
ncbi:atrial natriuretic peptide-converting enzyme-like [Mercenaria mercenaria]|uniref:atrial natriuretic peptide-converting enzyme-like n=1 Tax=Mercenaria mercenaria TaxID=6596 RepID=UPI00234F6890|nr:atrial natriuretic peptide-converting enzyme-like [Mercenaria mercenaria]XP_053373881.1 atrial natriuretic peptide-converting enzyme-like [Mercenaria mercenaria]XP_053373882.1 atrial natriuretic peptide-converting enzyme-like [Mercenaria mercenaria]